VKITDQDEWTEIRQALIRYKEPQFEIRKLVFDAQQREFSRLSENPA
jgi:hypothetical protein